MIIFLDFLAYDYLFIVNLNFGREENLCADAIN